MIEKKFEALAALEKNGEVDAKTVFQARAAHAVRTLAALTTAAAQATSTFNDRTLSLARAQREVGGDAAFSAEAFLDLVDDYDHEHDEAAAFFADGDEMFAKWRYKGRVEFFVCCCCCSICWFFFCFCCFVLFCFFSIFFSRSSFLIVAFHFSAPQNGASQSLCDLSRVFL